MKKLILCLLLALPLIATAQSKDDMSKYLAGAVPVNESGFVYFAKDYEVPGKSAAELFTQLRDYTLKSVVEGPDHLPQARITEADSVAGTVVASMEEYLYFKRKAWTMDRVRFYYQLIFHVSDGKFNVEMRNLRYLYDDIADQEVQRAEQWITDEEALKDNGTKLRKIPGKFRRFTIDRKDDIFRGAARAVGAAKKTRMIEVEE